MRDETTRPRREPTRSAREARVWAIAIVLLIVADATMHDRTLRLALFRGVVALTAAGEALAFLANGFRPRQFAERNGRAYDVAYHGVMQDFGFYNFGFALLLGVAAVDPVGARSVIVIVVATYALHGVTHVFRYFERYYGGGTPIATRPQLFEMRDGLQLLAAAVGMVLFRAH